MQTQLVAELPLPAHVPVGQAQGASAPDGHAKASSAGNNGIVTKSGLTTRTLSISLTCRIVRLVPEGICVDFMPDSAEKRLAVETFLISAAEGAGTVQRSAVEASSARPTRDTVFTEGLKDFVEWLDGLSVKVRGALQIVERTWSAAIGKRVRIQQPQPVANEKLIAFPTPPLLSPAARPSENPTGSVAAPPIPIGPNKIAPFNGWAGWAHRTREPIKWAVLIAAVVVALAIAWRVSRAFSRPARIPLSLQVVSRDKQLEIRWNHDATPIRNAASGLMRISDGGVQEVIEIDATQLRDGVVAYTPTTNDVSVRLEVNGVDGTSSSESVRSVAIP